MTDYRDTFVSKSKPILTRSLARTSPKSIDRRNTLQRRLLLTILPTVLIPLAVASAIGFNVTQRRATEVELRQLQKNSQLTSEEWHVSLEHKFQSLNLVARNSALLDAMRSGAELAESKKLPQQDIKKTEAQFGSTRLIQTNAGLNNYLKQVAKDANLAEMFVTERNGFNVAFSNMTSDFVQSDEKWWQNTKQKGQVVDSPAFDNSAKTVVVALSQAIKDPKSGKFLGVISSQHR
jgi:twitching motility protein PilJ